MTTPRTRWLGERLFYAAMGCGFAITVFLGFSESYYLRGAGTPLRVLLRVHGALFSSWILLFIVQTGLISAHRVDVHRRVGIGGAVLAVAMIGVGTTTALEMAAHARGQALRPVLTFLAIPLFDMLVFAVLVGAALACRRIPQTHKRLLVIATIGLLSPAIGRMHWPPAFQGVVSDFVLPDLFLLPLVVWDVRTRGRLHRATVLGGLFLVASQVGRSLLAETDAWMRFASWAAGLVVS